MLVKETYIVIDKYRFKRFGRLATIYETVDGRFFYDSTGKFVEVRQFQEITEIEALQIIEETRTKLAI
jgi:hypothetical protein